MAFDNGRPERAIIAYAHFHPRTRIRRERHSKRLARGERNGAAFPLPNLRFRNGVIQSEQFVLPELAERDTQQTCGFLRAALPPFWPTTEPAVAVAALERLAKEAPAKESAT